MPAAGAKLRGASNMLFLFVWFTVFPLLLNFGVAKMAVFYTSRWTELKNRTHEKVSWRTIVSHNHSTGKSVAWKPRTNAPPESLWAEKLAQSPHRKVCGLKTSRNRPTGKSVAWKPRAIGPMRWFWGENLAQSAQRKVCGPKDSHNRPNEMVLERKTRTIAPTRWFWREKLAQSAQRDGFGAKNSHNQPPRKCFGLLSAAGNPRFYGW